MNRVTLDLGILEVAAGSANYCAMATYTVLNEISFLNDKKWYQKNGPVLSWRPDPTYSSTIYPDFYKTLRIVELTR